MGAWEYSVATQHTKAFNTISNYFILSKHDGIRLQFTIIMQSIFYCLLYNFKNVQCCIFNEVIYTGPNNA